MLHREVDKTCFGFEYPCIVIRFKVKRGIDCKNVICPTNVCSSDQQTDGYYFSKTRANGEPWIASVQFNILTPKEILNCIIEEYIFMAF